VDTVTDAAGPCRDRSDRRGRRDRRHGAVTNQHGVRAKRSSAPTAHWAVEDSAVVLSLAQSQTIPSSCGRSRVGFGFALRPNVAAALNLNVQWPLRADWSHAATGARIMPWMQQAIWNNKCF
jgi:hypothetical protein